jgi:large subunit ribosomal protein L30
MLKVTLVKSKIANTPANRATVKALGLNKIGSTNTFEDSKSIRGMIHKVKHLLKVEEITEGQVIRRRQDGKAMAEKRRAKLSGVMVAPAVVESKPKAKAKKNDAEPVAEEKPKAKRATKKKTEEAES